MIRIEKYIQLVVAIWFICIASVIVIVPLHFFFTEHKSTCELDSNDSCTDTKTCNCEICAFDLYIYYLKTYNVDILRIDRLIAQQIIFVNQGIISYTKFFASLRAPPYLLKKYKYLG